MNQDTWDKVDALIERDVVREDAALRRALESSREAGLPSIAVSPAQGKLLQVLAITVGAHRVLEIGTLGGYSTIWMARGLAPGGRVTTLEIEPAYAKVAQTNFERAGVADRIELRLGPAMQSLERLAAERTGPFDLVFIDADKQNMPAYYEWALQLARPGTLILLDNVVREGEIVDQTSTDERVVGTRRVLARLGEDERVIATAIQTVGIKGYDGFAVAVVLKPGTPA